MSIKTTKVTKPVVKPTHTFASFAIGSFFLRPGTENVYLKNTADTAVKVGQVGNDNPIQRTRTAAYFNGLELVPVDASLTVAV
jgi:hypothetical protein